MRINLVFLMVILFFNLPACVYLADTSSQNKGMTYSPTKKSVHFRLIAAKNANNNGYNYNGYYQGNVDLQVPVDWKVTITLVNQDANAVHSVILTRPFLLDDMPDELSGEFAVIARAYTDPIFSGEQETLQFIAKEGRYWLFCGIKGHGINGMWIKFSVLKNLKIPLIVEQK